MTYKEYLDKVATLMTQNAITAYAQRNKSNLQSFRKQTAGGFSACKPLAMPKQWSGSRCEMRPSVFRPHKSVPTNRA